MNARTATRVAAAIVGAALLLGLGYVAGRGTNAEREAASPPVQAPSTWTCRLHSIIQETEPGECPICGLALVVDQGASTQPATQPSTQPATRPASGAVTWTCSMDPQIKLPRPGSCPICGMDLVPLEATPDAGPRSIVLTEADRTLARITTAPVERRGVSADIRMVGKVGFDETRVKTISAWVPGRVDRLFVDYTGIPVKKGEHVAMLYSPDLLTAQQELIEARRWVDRSPPEPSAFLREASARTLESAREKLRLLGLSDEQVQRIEDRGTAEESIMITSPTEGIVVEKEVQEGDYVQTGSKLYAIADLSHLWVLLDAYESDLPWIRYGQRVTVEAEALPGRSFPGFIAFIDPVLNARTRTVRVRVNVENPDRSLKPEMFVRAVVRSEVARGGRVMDPRLAGKWIGPMHPEVIRDGPGDCTICGMPLVRAEDLGYVSSGSEQDVALVVPATAVLRTGKRAVVYVEVPDTAQPTYEGREIHLGPRAGDHYVVLDGLAEGERVVVEGNFKIDSALQIQAKPSMMTTPAHAPAR